MSDLIAILIVAFAFGWIIRSAKRLLFDTYLPSGAMIAPYTDARVDTVRRPRGG